jgi:hypothetical protein
MHLSKKPENSLSTKCRAKGTGAEMTDLLLAGSCEHRHSSWLASSKSVGSQLDIAVMALSTSP